MSRLFGPICQNGYVVRDIDQALEFWTKTLQVGPFFHVRRVKLDWYTYKGEPSPLDMTIALANSGGLQIELIQQLNDAPSMYRDFLEAVGEGLQHTSHWTTDYQDMYDRALVAGFTVGHEGQIGGPKGRFAYFESSGHPGTVIEISDISGRKGRFFEHVRTAAQNWDGTEPIRLLD